MVSFAREGAVLPNNAPHWPLTASEACPVKFKLATASPGFDLPPSKFCTYCKLRLDRDGRHGGRAQREGPNAAPSAATQGAVEHLKTSPLTLRLRSLTLLLIFPVQQVAMQSDFLCDNQNQNGDHRHQSKVCHEYDQAGPKVEVISC